MLKVTTASLFAGLVTLASGCDHSPSPTDAGTPGASSTPSRQIQLASPLQTIDDEFARIAREEIPGFGGAFFDQDDVLNVYLTDPRVEGAAIAALRRIYGDEKFSLGSGPRTLNQVQTRVLRGQYGYGHLKRWRDQMRPVLNRASLHSLYQ